MSEQQPGPEEQKQAEGYRKLLETARHYIEEAGEKSAPIVEKAVQQAEESLSTAGEYTREEMQKLGDYLRRDLHDAADYMERTGREYADWLRLDILKIETSLAESFLRVADRTRTELANWVFQSETHTWHSGEIAGPGTLQCIDCGELLHFHEPGHVPPCPKCHGSRFRRVVE